MRVWAPSVKYDDVMERTTADVMRTLAEAGIPAPGPFGLLADVVPPAAPGGRPGRA